MHGGTILVSRMWKQPHLPLLSGVDPSRAIAGLCWGCPLGLLSLHSLLVPSVGVSLGSPGPCSKGRVSVGSECLGLVGQGSREQESLACGQQGQWKVLVSALWRDWEGGTWSSRGQENIAAEKLGGKGIAVAFAVLQGSAEPEHLLGGLERPPGSALKTNGKQQPRPQVQGVSLWCLGILQAAPGRGPSPTVPSSQMGQ